MTKQQSQPLYNLNKCTPNREQTWLLKMCVKNGEEAEQAWQAWRTHVNLDDIDPASYRLLPLAYRNLVNLGVEDSLLGRLKGIYRHSWYKNQMTYRHAREIIALFQEAGIRVMLLKGAAMSICYYQDNGIRFMRDVDIMVPRANYAEALQIMDKLDWQTKTHPIETLIWYSEHQFLHSGALCKNDFELDLHYQLLPFVPQEKESYWSDATCKTWFDQTVYFPSATDLLFHTCVHGISWSHAYLSWIPDALFILNHEPIAWQSLIKRAEETRMIVFLRNSLGYLQQEFQAPIPAEILQQLNDMPVSGIEIQEYKLLSQPLLTVTDVIKQNFFRTCRYNSLKDTTKTQIGLPLNGWEKYFLIRWHLHSWHQLVPKMASMLKKNLKEIYFIILIQKHNATT